MLGACSFPYQRVSAAFPETPIFRASTQQREDLAEDVPLFLWLGFQVLRELDLQPITSTLLSTQTLPTPLEGSA